jgi:glycosyltransferase involved in cell wall biosynthesis
VQGAMNTTRKFTVVGYSNNPPSNALVTLRMSGPLQACGIQYVAGNIPGEFCRPELVSQADIVVIQRDFPVSHDVYEIMARARAEGKRVVFDLDDLLLELPDDHPNLADYGRPSVMFPMMQALVEADSVTVSTPALAAYCREFNQNVWVLPNYLDESIWLPEPATRPRPPDAPVVIGFQGTDSHVPDLLLLRGVFSNLKRRYGSRVHLHLVGCPPPREIVEDNGDDWLTWTPSSLVSYSAFAAQFSQLAWDISLAPLRNNLFNRCKSQIKFLEYSALRIPGVYADLPPYESIVSHGENGFLAQQPEEWERYLSLLIESPRLRHEIGNGAHATVQHDWLLCQHACEWSDTYRHIASSTFQPVRDASAVRVAQQATRIGRNPLLLEVSMRELNEEYGRRIDVLSQTIQYLEAVNTGYRNGRIMRLMTGLQTHLGRLLPRSLSR